MRAICKETTDLPQATGSADVKPLSQTQELPPPLPRCKPQLLAFRICNLHPTTTLVVWLAGWLGPWQHSGGTPHPSLGSALQPDFREICFALSV